VFVFGSPSFGPVPSESLTSQRDPSIRLNSLLADGAEAEGRHCCLLLAASFTLGTNYSFSTFCGPPSANLMSQTIMAIMAIPLF
jgi:hypothetical protein